MKRQKEINIGNDIKLGNQHPFVLIAGPDSIESEEHALMMATKIKEICNKLDIPFIFKACFDKANRTSVDSFRGVGVEEGLRILGRIKNELNISVTTDIHLPDQASKVGEVVDVIQIPALLSRQTDLLVAAGQTGKTITVKKGQFISPNNVQSVIDKVTSTGNYNVAIIERGYTFGYNNVVVDMRGLEIMKRETGYPIILDCSHTVQFPSLHTSVSGGDRTLIPSLVRAGLGVGVAGIFIEVHSDPDNAKVDGPSSLDLKDLEDVLSTSRSIDRVVKSRLI